MEKKPANVVNKDAIAAQVDVPNPKILVKVLLSRKFLSLEMAKIGDTIGRQAMASAKTW